MKLKYAYCQMNYQYIYSYNILFILETLHLKKLIFLFSIILS